jgi:predicted metal-dependent peptidase
MACVPGSGPFAKYPKGLAAEQYFEMLKEDEQFKPKDGEGEGEGTPDTMDDHSGWSEQDGGMDNTTNEIAKEGLKEALKKAAEEANRSNNWGSIPADVRKQIMERLNPTVDWRKMLRYFIKTSKRCDKSSTVRRINKRFPRIHAGKKVNRIANIAISIDQSGSVSDEMLALFFTELNELANLATFTVIPFDTRVDANLVYVWKKGKKHVWERVMCGGTDFNAPTKYVNEGDFDGHIVLTDMQAPKPIPSGCSRMWMTDKANAASPYFKTNEVVVPVGK